MIDLISFGEILWDIIDDKPHLGGAPLNLAAHATMCGINTAIISAVGNDDLGRKAIQQTEKIGIKTSWITRDSLHPTGTVSVKLINTIPQYTIHENVAWDNIVIPEECLSDIIASKPKAICFGTLAQRSVKSRASLKKLLSSLENTLIFYDVNLRQKFWSKALILESLKVATWLKVNDEEASLLNQIFFDDKSGFECFPENVFKEFDLDGIVITCGPEGCRVCERNSQPVDIAPVDVEVIDTVGAGDAFSAAFLTALLQGKNAYDAAKEGNRRGALVASKPGAIPVI